MSKKPRYMRDGVPVEDAVRDVTFTINPDDVKQARPKDPHGCAAALACQRVFKTDAMVYRSRAYIRRGKRWLRYVTPPSLLLEIVALDRGGRFEASEFRLEAPDGATRLGYFKKTGQKNGDHKGRKTRPRHVTGDVRVNAPKPIMTITSK